MNGYGKSKRNIPRHGDFGEMAYQNRNTFSIDPLPFANPQKVGEMLFQLTNDTTLVVKVMGSDGVLRSATLALS